MYFGGFKTAACSKCGGYLPGDPNFYLNCCYCKRNKDKNKS